MKTRVYLVFDKKGFVAARKTKPHLDRGQVAYNWRRNDERTGQDNKTG